MSFLSKHGSLRRPKKPSPSPAPSTSSEVSNPTQSKPAYVAAHKVLERAHSASSTPSSQRKYNMQVSEELVKVVLRDFPGWNHDQLISLRGVPAAARCSTCACVAGSQLKAPCGCAYCEVCMRHVQSTSLIQCRLHGAKTHRSDLIEDPYVYSLCMELNAMCIWNTDGCNYEAPLSAIQEHSKHCIFREENCRDCDRRLSFRAMASHRNTTCTQRKVNCEMCKAQVLASSLERHISVCPEVEINCLSCGRQDIKRGESEAHRVQCTSIERICRMNVFGCEIKGTNAELRDHETIDNHMDLFCKYVSKQEERLRQVEDNPTKSLHKPSCECQDLTKVVEGLRSQILQLSNRLVLISTALVEDPFYWNLCPYKAILEEDSDGAQVLYSDSFYTPSIPGYKMRLRLLVDHRARLLHFTPQVLPGQFNNIIPWPFPAQYLLRLVDQSGLGQHKDLTVTTGAAANLEKPTEAGRVLRSPNLQIKFDELEQSGSGAPMYSRNDCIVFMFKINLSSDFLERL